MPTTEQRFWAKVKRGSDDECWLWQGAKTDRDGYGRFTTPDGKQCRAHRMAYEYLVGPIPDETLDHRCLVKLCCNPAHLDPCSIGENARRHAQTITECAHGHPYDEENTYWNNGKRYCRACGRRKWHERKAKK